jgi:hypothetical protein
MCVLGANIESVVANQFELVCGKVSDDSVIIKDYRENIVCESASIADVNHHAVAEFSLDWHWVSEFVNHRLHCFSYVCHPLSV